MSSSEVVIINCTPHTVNVLDPSNLYFNPSSMHYIGSKESIKVIASYEPSGIIPRCVQKEEFFGRFDGIPAPLVRMTFGDVEELPEEKEGTFYIVSNMVAKACPNRHDLLIPAHLVRNGTGNEILGCTAFAVV